MITTMSLGSPSISHLLLPRLDLELEQKSDFEAFSLTTNVLFE